MKSILFAGSDCGDALKGLRTLVLDTDSGALSEAAVVDDARNPIYLAASADGNFLYAAEDVSSLGVEGLPGGVSLYLVARDGSLARVGSWAVAPTVSCHISLSPDGKLLAWAEYRNAHAGVMAVDDSGWLAPLASVHHEGHGPNPVRQDAAHCHFAHFLRDNRTLLVCDLGLDRVVAYRVDPEARTMTAAPELGWTAPAGCGPRHLAFLPGTDLAFLVAELSSEIFSLRVAPGRAPELLDRRSLLPDEGCDVPTKAAAVRVSPDGRWVLASNRGHDSIASFRIDVTTGRLTPGMRTKLQGPFPRDFEFAPGGNYVVVGHKLGHNVATYAFDRETGALRFVPGSEYTMTKPLAFVFPPACANLCADCGADCPAR